MWNGIRHKGTHLLISCAAGSLMPCKYYLRGHPHSESVTDPSPRRISIYTSYLSAESHALKVAWILPHAEVVHHLPFSLSPWYYVVLPSFHVYIPQSLNLYWDNQNLNQSTSISPNLRLLEVLDCYFAHLTSSLNALGTLAVKIDQNTTEAL